MLNWLRKVQLKTVFEGLIAVILAVFLILEASFAGELFASEALAAGEVQTAVEEPVSAQEEPAAVEMAAAPEEPVVPEPAVERTVVINPGDNVAADMAVNSAAETAAEIKNTETYQVEVLDQEEAKAAVSQASRNSRSGCIRLLAQTVWGEARGINSKVEQAAVVWCVLNRLDSRMYGSTIYEVVSDKEQFGGWHEDNPVLPHHEELAEDIYDAWQAERDSGETSELRTLPHEYRYYWGDNVHNWFVTDSVYIGQKGYAWTWGLGDPYKESREEYLAKYYPTKHELTMMAQTVWAKARGIDSTKEQAAIVWRILNRVQSEVYEDTVKDVLEHKGQFNRYNQSLSIDRKYYKLVVDVVDRWHQEMNGASSVGRVLPSNYLYFRGNGTRNYFYTDRHKSRTWNWSNPNPYAD